VKDEAGDARAFGQGLLQRRPGEYASAGKMANLDQFATATLSNVVGGNADGCRALDLRAAGGIDLRILPDRGFDLGSAWFRGVPLAWISAAGERPPQGPLDGMAWIEAFGGGLLTTCGLRNVGAPSEGHSLHGRYSHLVATDVQVNRHLDDGDVVLTAQATIDETEPPSVHLRLERRVRTRTGSGLVELSDVATNLGEGSEPAPILYHVNVGLPLFDEGARVEIDAEEVLPRDADAERGLDSWMAPGPPVPGAAEMVFEHLVRPDPSGWGRAAVVNPSLGLQLDLRWRLAELPRFHQWIHPRPGIYALGLEPANCSVLGRAADRAAGMLPILEPLEARTTELRIAVRPALWAS
jgi:uncharacterized protein DUF4432